MELYTIEGAVDRVSKSMALLKHTRNEIQKTSEKHHYVVHLILSNYLRKNNFGEYVNISSKQLKDVLGRDYVSILSNLQNLKIININDKYSTGSFSKSYLLHNSLKDSKIIRLTLKSSHMIKKLTKERELILAGIQNDELFAKIDRHTKNLFLIDEATKFLPERDKVLHGEINQGFKISFVSFEDNPYKIFRYEEFRRGLLSLSNNFQNIEPLHNSVFYQPSISSAGRVYHMVTSIPRKIRAGLRTKKNELIYEVDMASAQPSILFLEWFKLLKSTNKLDGNQEANRCLKLLIQGEIYKHVKDNSPHFRQMKYDELKKAILTILNSKDYPSKERDELSRLFPGFINWLRDLKKTYGHKQISFIGQSAEAKIFIGTYRELDTNIFALPIHDCILTTNEHIQTVKDLLILKTKQLYAGVIDGDIDLSQLFKTGIVSIDNNEISTLNWVKYIMEDCEEKQAYLEEYPKNIKYKPLGEE